MKCVIIDDEPIARKGMRRLIETRSELTLVAEFDSASKAAEWFTDNDADLVFLDIEMPGMNGIDFARRISAKSMVIFTTAYSDYAVEGFEVEALDYLVKPIDPVRFDKAVDRAAAYNALKAESDAGNPEADLEFIIVKADRKYMRLKLEDILYVEGLKDYVIIHIDGKRVVTRMTIKTIEETLPHPQFIRVNRSFIVNRDKIDAFDNNDVTVGTTEISLGLSYKDAVFNALLTGK